MNADDKDTHIASLIYWKSIEDKERIERWLQKLKDKGSIECFHTGTYKPEYGVPVWIKSKPLDS